MKQLFTILAIALFFSACSESKEEVKEKQEKFEQEINEDSDALFDDLEEESQENDSE